MLNEKGSSFIVILIVLIILGILGGGGFYYLKSHSSSVSSNASSENDPIKNHITLTPPADWKEMPNTGGDSLVYTSADLNITISRSAQDPNQQMETALHPQGEDAQYHKDIASTTVSSLKAVSYHNDYEGHDKSFVIAQDPNHVWEIHISSKSLDIENLHKAEIDSFINSIVIK